jgi:arsenite methyltransferase
MDDTSIKSYVRSHYAEIAKNAGSCCEPSSSCCGESAPVNRLVDYGDLAIELIDGADLGLGCGMPTKDAGIRPGDTVLDLGSGAGVDVFLASRTVGPQGKVIGVDMTPEMIAKAWDNAVQGGYSNVDFRLGEIENLPVSNESVDVVISNCVLNLVPDKTRAFAEIYRVIKPGGHFTVSDIVTYGEIPAEIRQDVELWAGCIAGAEDRDEYLEIVRQAGFVDLHIHSFVEYDNGNGEGYGFASLTLEGRKYGKKLNVES